MFDLFRSRQKTTRYLLTAVLLLVALSMVVTLIPGFGSSGYADGPDPVIAEVGDEKITMREVQMSLTDTLRAQNIPNDLISIYAPMIVNQIVTDRAVIYYARQMGFKATDEDVAAVIRRMIPQLWENGQFVGKEAYANFLASNNTSIQEFERQARNNALLRRLEGMILEGMVVTPEEIKREFILRNEEVALDFVKIDPEKLKSEIQVTAEEINAHWNTSKASYRIPEKRSFALLVADEQKTTERIEISDDELRKVYNENRDNFRTPERVRARHILIKTQGKPAEEEPALKKKAEDLLKQIRAGADFAELARKNSEDTTSAVKGGDLDFFTRGIMVKAFDDAVFALKVNQISDLVKTEFGYHIIQVTAKEEARLKPFEEVKADIRQQLAKEKVYDRMTNATDQARERLRKNPNDAERIAAELGLDYQLVEQAKRGDVLPLVGSSIEVDEQVFALQEPGQVTDVVQVQGNKLAVAALREVIPARQAELREVESQVRDAILNERAQRLLITRSQQVMDKVRENGGDLRKAAAAFKLEVKTAPEFNRDGNAEGIGQGGQIAEAFKRDVGAVFGPVGVGGSNFICKVIRKTPPDMSKLSEQSYDILIRLKGQKAERRKDLFEDGILQHLKQKGVVKIHEDSVKRLVDSYKNS